MDFGWLWCFSIGWYFIEKKKSIILVSDVGGSCVCVGAGSVWEIALSSPQFCCKIKTALKIKSLKDTLNFFKKYLNKDSQQTTKKYAKKEEGSEQEVGLCKTMALFQSMKKLARSQGRPKMHHSYILRMRVQGLFYFIDERLQYT